MEEQEVRKMTIRRAGWQPAGAGHSLWDWLISTPFTIHLYNWELITWATWCVCLAPHPWSRVLLWPLQSYLPVDPYLLEGQPSSFHSPWIFSVRARQEPEGMSTEEYFSNLFFLLDQMTIQQEGKRGQWAPVQVCNSYPSCFLLEMACLSTTRQTWRMQQRKQPLFDSYFNYFILNYSSVIVDNFYLHPGPASYKVPSDQGKFLLLLRRVQKLPKQ